LHARYIDLIQEMHWLFIPHVQAVVTPDHDVFGTHLTDHELHDRFGVNYRIEREALQIFARELGQLQLFDFWPHAGAVVDSPHQHQQHSPAVRQCDLKLRVPVEHAPENKMAGGDGSVEGEAQYI
jgi:hypothetical protein